MVVPSVDISRGGVHVPVDKLPVASLGVLVSSGYSRFRCPGVNVADFAI